METIHLITFLVAFVSSVLSGVAGGGGGFLVAPYWLLIGLTPAQGAATGAFMALGMSGGSLAAFRGSGFISRHRRLVATLLCMTFATSLIGPFFLDRVDPSIFTPILATLTLLSVPLLFWEKPVANAEHGHTLAGFGGIFLLLLASSFITSSAFSIFISILMLRMFRLGVLEGTAVKRIMGIVQSGVIFIVLALLGNFLWQHALAGAVGGVLGSFVGTKISLHRGERFARSMLAVGGIVGAALLLIR